MQAAVREAFRTIEGNVTPDGFDGVTVQPMIDRSDGYLYAIIRLGRGLGLSIVEEAVENLGGGITLEEGSGGGALFRVEVPLPEGETGAGGEPRRSPEEAGPAQAS